MARWNQLNWFTSYYEYALQCEWIGEMLCELYDAHLID